MTEENVFEQLTNEYYQLTSAEKKIADSVFSLGPDTQSMSISRLAEYCGVAEATISRFCRRLGYESYGAFRRGITATVAADRTAGAAAPLHGAVEAEDTVSDMASKLAEANKSAIDETRALLQEEALLAAADTLRAAETVLCMGQGGSMVVAQEAANLFGTVFPRYFPVSDSHTQIIRASQLTERDVILYCSYSGATSDLMDLLRVAKQRGVKVILLTRYPNSPGAGGADVVLRCGTTESPLQMGSVPARIAQIYLLDVLFTEVCRRDMDDFRRRRARVADALAEKHV
ncbi:MAG: MurR/RpiR family transcriptional regulator [Oscillospiraceae bacterium]|nr:MurR/RpiR family transcriptional regulator [Oscillospiraceae bacterium]